MLKTPRAQMKIQQMAFMLIALTLFLAIAGLMVAAVKFSDIKDSASVLREENAQLLALKIANTPEFSCEESFSLGSVKSNCVDFDKIIVLKNQIQKYKNIGSGNNKDNFWGRGVTNIEIRKVFPIYENEKKCTIGTYPNCSVIKLLSDEAKGTTVSNFVSLCRVDSLNKETYGHCEIAKIMVTYEKVN